jgi:hypothetical protein
MSPKPVSGQFALLAIGLFLVGVFAIIRANIGDGGLSEQMRSLRQAADPMISLLALLESCDECQLIAQHFRQPQPIAAFRSSCICATCACRSSE